MNNKVPSGLYNKEKDIQLTNKYKNQSYSMTRDKVTERSLREYLVDKMKENGFTSNDLKNLKNILGDTQLKNVFADLNYDWTAFEEYTDELIDKSLHGEQYETDDTDDLETFDNRYDEEGFIKSREYRHDELPPDFDDSDLITDVYPVYGYGGYYNYDDYKERERQREIEQRRYEMESERGRKRRLACKTPEELYDFKCRMGWIPRLVGKSQEERDEIERTEFEKCVREIEARNETNESYKNNIGRMANRYYNGNSMKRSNGLRMYEMMEDKSQEDFFKKEIKGKVEFSKIEPLEDGWVDDEKILQCNGKVDTYVDEDNGDVIYYIDNGRENIKWLGVPYNSIFESEDKQVLPYLWSTDGGKTVHALDINGNVISPEFIGMYYGGDWELLLSTDDEVYISASWVSTEIAHKMLSNPICDKNQLIGFGGLLGARVFFEKDNFIKYVNLDDDITTVHSYEMTEESKTRKPTRIGNRLYELESGPGVYNEPDRLGLLAEAKRIYASVSRNLGKLIRMVDILEDRAEYIDELDIHSSSFYFDDIDELKEEIKNMRNQLTGAKDNNIMYLTKKFATCAMPVFPYTRDNGKGLNVHYVNEPNWLEESGAAKRKSVERRLYESDVYTDPDRLGLIAEARRIHASIIPELDKLIRMTDIISERADYIDQENIHSSSYFFKNAEELKKEIRNLRQYIINEKKLVTFYTEDFITCVKVVFPYNRENGVGLNTSDVNTDYYSESGRERKPRRGNVISESMREYMNKRRGDTRR